MPRRRMLSTQILDSDSFMEMPLSSQCLYVHLCMKADDDGFLNNPKQITRFIGASEDDLKLLMVKKFILAFESGVIVIKHWHIHNYIAKDRYTQTIYQEEKNQLVLDDNKIYHQTLYTSCIHSVDNLYTQVKLSKDKLSKDKLSEVKLEKKNIDACARENFPPTLEEVCDYFYNHMDFNVDYDEPHDFISYNQARNWEGVKDWKPLADMWHRKHQEQKEGGEV